MIIGIQTKQNKQLKPPFLLLYNMVNTIIILNELRSNIYYDQESKWKDKTKP